jgi:hypothetical protein
MIQETAAACRHYQGRASPLVRRARGSRRLVREGHGPNRGFVKERTDGIMGVARQLHLWHVPAIQLEVTGLWECLRDVLSERDRHEGVPTAPDEQGI